MWNAFLIPVQSFKNSISFLEILKINLSFPLLSGVFVSHIYKKWRIRMADVRYQIITDKNPVR